MHNESEAITLEIKMKATMIKPGVKYPARPDTGLRRVWIEEKRAGTYVVRGECGGKPNLDGDIINDRLREIGLCFNPSFEVVVCFSIGLGKAREAVFSLMEE